MHKNTLALMIVVVLFLAAPLRAEEDGDEELKPATTSAAAEAARNKGYATEETKPTVATEEENDAPIERHSQPKTLMMAPPQRQLGAGTRPAASSGGQGTSVGSGAGISCDKSVPSLAHVIHENLRSAVIKRYGNNAEGNLSGSAQLLWALRANQAISYKFTAPKSGGGGFATGMNTIARPEPTLMNVSQTPCDFDGEQAKLWSTVSDPLAGGQKRKLPNFCTSYNGNSDAGIAIIVKGAPIPAGANTSNHCFIEPGKTYYLNIRTLGINPFMDPCARDTKTMGPSLTCGGILDVRFPGVLDK